MLKIAALSVYPQRWGRPSADAFSLRSAKITGTTFSIHRPNTPPSSSLFVGQIIQGTRLRKLLDLETA
jgi:hypothetical protein